MKKIKVHSLTGRITSRLMRQAFQAVKRNRGAAGVDKVSIQMFAVNLEENLAALMRELKTGTFKPLPLRRVLIPKGPGSTKLRPLGIPICRSYCTSFQKGWGLSDGGPVPPSALFSFLRPFAATTSDESACASGR
jgi:hypothetical protein